MAVAHALRLLQQLPPLLAVLLPHLQVVRHPRVVALLLLAPPPPLAMVAAAVAAVLVLALVEVAQLRVVRRRPLALPVLLPVRCLFVCAAHSLSSRRRPGAWSCGVLSGMFSLGAKSL